MDDEQISFIERTHEWVLENLSAQHLRSNELVLPRDLYPKGYRGTNRELRRLTALLGALMDIPVDDIEFEFLVDDQLIRSLDGMVHGPVHSRYAAGTFAVENGQPYIRIQQGVVGDPIRIVAVLAHELCHYKMIVQLGIEEEDEHLTDMLPTYYGLGLFTSGSVHRRSNSNTPLGTSWTLHQTGYLSEYFHGYLLAKWVQFMRLPPRSLVPHLSPNVLQSYRRTMKLWDLWGSRWRKQRFA